MSSADCIVIGGGPAGVSAAVELAGAGLDVALFEQGLTLGGAIHRQSNDPNMGVPVPREQATRWRKLRATLDVSSVRVHTRHSFVGVDGGGAVLIEDRANGRLQTWGTKALLLAVGGLERVLPRLGGELPGVVTAGGLQVMMKSTVRPPAGAILLAGSGPLLIAVAAQLTALGAPPIAVLERSGNALSPMHALPLLAVPGYLLEAARHLVRLRLARVPIHLGTSIESIAADDGRLVATVIDASGRRTQLIADRIALHDGLRPNADTLPLARSGSERTPQIVLAGDCREVLGGVAAIADGRRAASEVISRLSERHVTAVAAERIVDRERHAQATLAKLFDFAVPDFSQLPDETVLCRCENRTMGDLRSMLAGTDTPSPREIKLNGRFGMGACQGRFCVEWTAAALAQQTGTPPYGTSEFTGKRWPIRPIAIASLLAPENRDAATLSNKSE